MHSKLSHPNIILVTEQPQF